MPKSGSILSKLKLRQYDVFNQIYFNSTVFNTQRKATMGQLTTVLVIIEILPKKYAKFGPKSLSTTKHCMFRATNLRQFREFYTNAVGDVADI